MQVTGTAPVFSTLKVYRNGEPVFTSAPAATGTFTALVPLIDGPILLYAESSNRAGASEPSNPVLVTRVQTLPVLSLALAQPSVAEGGSLNGTVSLDTALTMPLTVTLATSSVGRLSFPASVTIPAGQTSAAFTPSSAHWVRTRRSVTRIGFGRTSRGGVFPATRIGRHGY